MRLRGGKRSFAGMPGLIPDADPGWETALLLPVPAAEPAVSHHRARLDEAARDGVPAHVTVLYPFLPPAEISEPLLASLGRLFAGFAAFEFTLDRVGWFGEEVVWLGPRDPAPFSALTSAAFTAFPCCPPYGGQHGNAVNAALVRALNGAGSRGPSQTTSSPNQPTLSRVNSNAANPANSLPSDASSGSLISAGGRNG